MTSNGILFFSDWCLFQSSSAELPPAADGNKSSDLQLDVMKRVRDLGILNPAQDDFSKYLPWSSGILAEEEAEGV